MHSLTVMADACADALEAADDDPHWRGAYCSIIDPHSVLELIEIAKAHQEGISAEELQALGKLIRDLTGYIKLATGDKPDSVRDDLLLQARQLLGVTGL